jgi:hypothetical protein
VNKKIAERLAVLIGKTTDFDILLQYLEYEESLILDANRTAVEDRELRKNQGKLQLIHKMKGLRDTIRLELNK